MTVSYWLSYSGSGYFVARNAKSPAFPPAPPPPCYTDDSTQQCRTIVGTTAQKSDLQEASRTIDLSMEKGPKLKECPRCKLQYQITSNFEARGSSRPQGPAKYWTGNIKASWNVNDTEVGTNGSKVLGYINSITTVRTTMSNNVPIEGRHPRVAISTPALPRACLGSTSPPTLIPRPVGFTTVVAGDMANTGDESDITPSAPPVEHYLIDNWNSASPEPPSDQRRALVAAFLALDAIPEK
ncbi:uncharacterized protein BP5553_07341 [Venustampulla echinocandica]|uniref:Uncharacterized protein n=1 Tax=Venustampulla echinocandica TaxID=2656787 RepID=A0A370TJ89_9HELO|nr:uncharacterized protein BP5553_07341 [Venustampulla echinocandica]RDL35410.1 hypothetical protein BP5553_07341 [Venustampulla echinocandica]